MKKEFLYLTVGMLTVSFSAGAAEDREKRKGIEKKESVVAKKQISAYDKLIPANAKSRTGVLDLHMVKGKLYMEIPLNLMGRTFMLAGRISEISENSAVIAGEMPYQPTLVEWKMEGEKIYLLDANGYAVCNENDPISVSFRRNNLKPVMQVFPVAAMNKDKTKAVIDVSKFFCSDFKPLSPLGKGMPGRSPLKGSFRPDQSAILDFKAFPKNIMVRSRMAYTANGKPFTSVMTASLLLLPEEPMRPRLWDPRMGYFQDRRLVYSSEKDKAEEIAYIHRWRLEPKPEDMEKYKKGELVEPKKPIVYYVDDALPDKWRKYIKLGIEDWNIAFEAAGFKNAVIARDFPKDDPDFDPDDIRYNCFRYATTTVANAMGPSWTDPRSGEIIQASVYMYHNLLQLVHNWKFVQTAQVDPRVRNAVFDEENMGESLRYVASHEIGHTLGLMHNMGASYSIPVDSLRSPSFTAKYGTTTSIMDYARNNYVAQPQDKGVRLVPPLVGVYDIHMIKMGYRPVFNAATPEDEYDTLNAWLLEKADDPMFVYGAQQFNSIVLDPSAQTESLGDDAVKASRYGISNLRYIMKHLVEWTSRENRSYDEVQELYQAIVKQYRLYLNHCMSYIGGMYLYNPVVGENRKSFVPVSRAKQKEVVDFFFSEFSEMPEWIEPKEVIEYTRPDFALTKNADVAMKIQNFILRVMMNGQVVGKVANQEKFSDRPYTVREYMGDIFKYVWERTRQGKNLDKYIRNMQYVYVQFLMTDLGLSDKDGKGGRNLVEVERPEDVLSDYMMPCMCYEHAMSADRMSSNTGEAVSTVVARSIAHEHLKKVYELLKVRKNTGSAEDRTHYGYLFSELDKTFR